MLEDCVKSSERWKHYIETEEGERFVRILLEFKNRGREPIDVMKELFAKRYGEEALQEVLQDCYPS